MYVLQGKNTMHLAHQPITVRFDTVAWPLSAIVLYVGETWHSWCVHVYRCICLFSGYYGIGFLTCYTCTYLNVLRICTYSYSNVVWSASGSHDCTCSLLNAYACTFVIVWVSSYTTHTSSLPLSDYTRIKWWAEVFVNMAESLDFDATKPNQLLGFNFQSVSLVKRRLLAAHSSLNGLESGPRSTTTPHRTLRFATLVWHGR